MARFYSNENFPIPVVHELRRLGHDVLTVFEAGHANQSVPDEEVLVFASSENRAVLTINRKHFVRLHRQRPDHSGIVVCSLDTDFVGQADRIDTAVERFTVLHGHLLRVNRPG